MTGNDETVYREPPEPPATSGGVWWTSYRANLAAELTPRALEVVTVDCQYIVKRGIFGAGIPGAPPPPGVDGWPASRVRTGLVVGAVQSGKTASMFGVMAQALDAGADMIIVLSGTRLALWSQTFDRFVRQLDSAKTEGERRRRRILIPNGPRALSQDAGPSIARLYGVQRPAVVDALDDRRPMISFVLKHSAHLNALAKTLREDVYVAVKAKGRPFHLIVIDDEADDGSILDALAEAGQDPVYGEHKQTPRAIARLWEGGGEPGFTALPQVYATYIGYTATPQANLKQVDSNPLAPRDFVAALRTPASAGALDPRHSTFKEPGKLPKYYTGGSVYYDGGSGAGLCQETTNVAEHDLDRALRAYLVAGAIRAARRAEGCGPLTARDRYFKEKQDVVAVAGRPHTMLIHPSGMVQDHFSAATSVLTWAGVEAAHAANLVTSGANVFLPVSLAKRMLNQESLWREWYDSYASSAVALHAAFDLNAAHSLPPWDSVRQSLVEEVIPGTRVSVVNSDDRADNRPQFEPQEAADGSWRTPKDLATIFVAGNVMSRGLTLDGLTTTLFLRQSQQPFADTQMQMQRWFGYRGGDLELCRVFLTSGQLDLFRKYHENDEAQRRQIVHAMNASAEVGIDRAPKPMVLHGADFLATGKIGGLSRQRLYPGPKPMTRFTNGVNFADPNIIWVANLFARPTVNVEVDRLRGVFLRQVFDLRTAAEILDRLRYAEYHPDPSSALAEHWRSIEQLVGLPDDDELFPLYRAPPAPKGAQLSLPRDDCPFSVAAYLRLWAVALNKSLPGFFPTDQPNSAWSRLDLSDRTARQPQFRVGLRFGGQAPVQDGPLSELAFEVRPMRRAIDAGGRWDGQWASRNPGSAFYGDELMDYHLAGVEPPYRTSDGTREIRPFGHDGQILFHVLQGEGATGLTVAVGVCIPEGGPDQIPALIASQSSQEQ